MRSPLNILLRNGTVTPDRLPGLAAWYSADYGVLTQVGGGTAFASANSQYLSCASNATLQTGNVDFTIASWVKCTNSAEDKVVFCKGTKATTEFWLNVFHVSGAAQFAVGTGGAPVGYATIPAGAVPGNQWNLFICSFEASTNTLSLFLNNGTAYTGTSTNPSVSSGIFSIGSYGGTAGYQNGSIDEVAFWRRTLSSAERSWLYNNGAGRTYSEADAAMKTNLVSWWSMNAPASENWIDQHGTNHLSPSASRPTATDGVTFRAAGEGDTVRKWIDRSGNGFNATQTTSSVQGTFSTSGGAKSQPAISLAGTQRMDISADLLGGNSTLFALAYRNTLSGYGGIASTHPYLQGNGRGIIFDSGTSTVQWSSGTYSTVAKTSCFPSAVWTFFCGEWKSDNTVSAAFNSGVVASSPGSAEGGASTVIGQYRAGETANGLNGRICELVFLANASLSENRSRVAKYFNRKYSLGL